MRILIISVFAIFLVNTLAQAGEISAPIPGTTKIGYCKTDEDGLSKISMYAAPGEREWFLSLTDSADRVYYADYQKAERVNGILSIRMDLQVIQDNKVTLFIPSDKKMNLRLKTDNIRVGKETIFADKFFDVELSYDDGTSVVLACRSGK